MPVSHFTLAAPTVIATVDFTALPEDLVEALSASGAVLHVMERPAGSYLIRQAPDRLGAILRPERHLRTA